MSVKMMHCLISRYSTTLFSMKTPVHYLSPESLVLLLERHLGPGIVALLFLSAQVHNVHDIIYGDGRLCDVSCQDNFALALSWVLKHNLLIHYRHAGVH